MMLALLVFVLAADGGTDQVFVQADAVNLRAQPRADAEVVAKLPIAMACTRLLKLKEWVKLKCGEDVGFCKSTFVADEAPKLEALLEKGRDASLKPPERLNAALRAGALAPGDPAVQEVLETAFLETEFAQLDAAVKKGERVIASQRTQPCSTDSIPLCMTLMLESIDFDWHALSVRGSRFVSAMLRKDGELQVFDGVLSDLTGPGRIEGVSSWSEVKIRVRSKYKAPEPLLAALKSSKRLVPPKHSVSSPPPASPLQGSSLNAVRALDGSALHCDRGPSEPHVITAWLEGDLYDRWVLNRFYGQITNEDWVLSAESSGEMLLRGEKTVTCH